MKTNIFNLLVLALLALFYIGLDPYVISIILFGLIIFRIVDKIGKGIVILEVMLFFSTLTYLVMPILGYEVYNRTSKVALLWQKIMPIPKEMYFDYFLPCILMLYLGSLFHFSKNDNIDEGVHINSLVPKLRVLLKDSLKIGIILSTIGIIFSIINTRFGNPFGYFGSLVGYLLYPGLMYIYFTQDSKAKNVFFFIDVFFILYDAYSSTMFTYVVYMGAVLFSIAFVGKAVKVWVKWSLFILAVCSILFIQGLKSTLRNNVGSTNTFQISNANQAQKAFSEEGFFPLYSRFNQGFLSSLVLNRFPNKQEFDNGSTIILTVTSSFVPRFFWPDKPTSGGIYNMKHFAGFTLKGYTMNVGPPGEAYGNFGKIGGIIYMFFFGLFIRFFYLKTLQIAKTIPLLILWFPITFFSVLYCMENDTLQAVNALTKGSFFIFLIYKFFPNVFGYKSKSIND